MRLAQATIIDILLAKLTKAAKQYDIRDIAIAGGVSANSGLRDAIAEEGRKRGWRTFLPEFRFTTDNAAMIAVTGYFKYQRGEFAPMDISPSPASAGCNAPRFPHDRVPNRNGNRNSSFRRTRAGRGRCFRLSISCAAYSVNAENLPAKSGRTLDHTVQFLRQNTASGISCSDSAQEILPNLGNGTRPVLGFQFKGYGIRNTNRGRPRAGNPPISCRPLANEGGTVFPTKQGKNSAGFLTKAGGITVTERYLSERASTCASPRPARSPR